MMILKKTYCPIFLYGTSLYPDLDAKQIRYNSSSEDVEANIYKPNPTLDSMFGTRIKKISG